MSLISFQGTFFFSVSFLAFLFVILFCLKKKPFPFYFFIAAYSIISLNSFNYFLYLSNLYIDYPHLYRVWSPLQYLIPPFSYFFVLFTLKPERRFKWVDLLHFLPFLFHAIELVPFYMLPTAEKLEIVKESYKGVLYTVNLKDGKYFSFGQHWLFKYLLLLIYLFFIWRLIYNYEKNATPAIQNKNTSLLKWIKYDAFLKVLLSIMGILSMYFIYINSYFWFLVWFVGLFDLILGFAYPLLNPHILSGITPVEMPLIHIESSDTEEEEVITGKFEYVSDPDKLRFFNQIEAYMQLEQPYLSEDFSRSQLANKLKCPLHKITVVIKGESGSNFSDYVNQYRLKYIEQELKRNKAWKNFTIEAIAIQSGFNTRAAFNNSVKRIKNMTPAEFVRNSS